tara:strand:+ start:4009 stop:11562 length:7554 start_codon:yes stop_codon:yes gene_type:complete
MITRAFQTPVRDGNNFAKLFNKLQEDGKYSKSFEDFEAQFGNDEGAARLHAKLTEDGVYTKSFDDFKTQFDVGVEKVKDTSFDTRMLAAGIDINSANNKGTSNNKILEGSIADIGTDQEMPEFDDPTTKEIEGQKDKYGMSRAFWQGQTETNPFMEGFDAKRDPDGGIPSLSDFFVVDPNQKYKFFNEDTWGGYIGQTVQSTAASFVSGVLDIAGGVSEFIEGTLDAGLQTVANAYNFVMPGDALDISDETQRKISGVIESAFFVDDAIHIMADGTRKFQTERDPNGSILDSIKAGDIGDVFERTMDGVAGAIPSVIAAANPYGIAAIAASSAGSHYEERTQHNPESRGLLMYSGALLSGGVEAASEMITRGIFNGTLKLGGFKPMEAVKNIYGKVAVGAGMEAVSEVASQEFANFQDQFGQAGINRYYNEDGEFDATMVMKRMFDTALVSGIIGGGTTIYGNMNQTKKALVDERMMAPHFQTRRREQSRQIFDLEAQKRAAQKEGNEIMVKELQSKINKIKTDMTIDIKLHKETVDQFSKDEQVDYFKKLDEINEIDVDLRNKKLSEKGRSDLEALRKQKEQELNDMYDIKVEQAKQVRADKLESNISIVDKYAKKLGFTQGPTIFEDENGYYEQIMMDNGLNSVQEARDLAEGSDAVFVGGGKIYINKQQALRVGAVSVASHELLHPVLNATVGDKAAQSQIVKDFKNQMTRAQRRYVEKRLKESYDPKDWDTEYLNIFSDGIQKGDINYDKDLFEKLGDFLTTLFKGKGFENISFDSGRDVYNFMKAYNNSVKTGNIDGEVVNAIKNAEQKSGRRAATVGTVNNMQMSRTERAEQSRQVNEEYQSIPDKTRAGFNIAMKYRGMAETVFQRILDSGNYTEDQKNVLRNNKEDIISMMLYDKIPNQRADSKARNVLGLVEGFDAVKNQYGEDGVAGYINKFFARRSAEVIKYYIPDAMNEGLLNEDGSIKRFIEGRSEDSRDPGEDKKARALTSFERLTKGVDQDGNPVSFIDVAMRSKIAETITKTLKLDIFNSRPIFDGISGIISGEVTRIVKNAMGKISKDTKTGEVLVSQEYVDLLGENYETMIKALPIEVIKKRYPKLFKIKQTGREQTAVGRGIFDIQKPTKQEWIDYHTKGGYTTLLARQKALSEIISEEIVKNEVTKLAQDPEFIQEMVDVGKMSNPDLTKFLLETELKSLTDSLDRKKSEKASFDNVQFSKSLNAEEKTEFKDSLPGIIKDLENINPTKGVVKNILTKYHPNWDAEKIDTVATRLSNAVKKYREFAEDEVNNVLNPSEFIYEEVQNASVVRDLFNLFAQPIQKIGELFRKPALVENLRAINVEYFNRVINTATNKEAGVIKLLKWISTHHTTAGASYIKDTGGGLISIGRNQIFAGNKDFLDILNQMPGVDIKYKETITKNGIKKYTITSLVVDGKPVEDFKQKIKTPAQAAPKTKSMQDYIDDYDNREAQAKEAWNTLTDYLDFMFEQVQEGNMGMSEFIMTLASLNSNMNTMLRQAANVKYHFIQNPSKPYKGKLVYEHLIPASYIIAKLAQHYTSKLAGGKGIDLDMLQEKYTVAIVPEVMDTKINKLRKFFMPSTWDFMNNNPVDRYFDDATLGFGNMFALQDLSNPDLVYGREHVANSDWQFSRSEFDNLKNYNKAIENARNVDAPRKGISVLDFDDTLAYSDSQVIVNMKDGEVIRMTPAQFATEAENIADMVESFDFSEFNDVKSGKPGPFLKRALELQDKFGSDNIFVLTARPQAAAGPIHKFLSSLGLNIPIENITGLEDGTPQAKADWILSKVAQGYNDFLFADDAIKNVKAVDAVLKQVDVKSDVQQARAQFSKTMGRQFDEILEKNKGVDADTIFSDARARSEGKRKGWEFWLPPGAEDFKGLIYAFLGKGKVGEAQMEFFNETLIKPFSRAMMELAKAKQAYATNFKALKKKYPQVRKRLSKKTNYGNFTNDDAIRVYIWSKLGYDIPGINDADRAALLDIVIRDPELKAFADGLELLSSDRGYPQPGENWVVGNTATDMRDLTDKVARKEFLAEWIKNKNEIFTKERLNKIEAIYGENFRDALEDMLYRMENGTNRVFGSKNKLVNAFTNWINNSVGAIMFFNMRSALLQTISFVNFMNWSDNNPMMFGKAILNTKQFAKDFVTIFNSDLLKQRRSGLGYDINEAEIAEALEGSRNGPAALLRYLLRVGFTPTQIADSFAISMGGATFYRNRINTYMKQGMSKAEAETKAFEDFAATSEESQQSARPDFISQQQAGPLGRLILAFQNTPMQYMRLTKKAFLDLKNGRGDFKTNVSKIIYYTAIQNIIFTSMQSALFALLFADDEEDEEILDKKGMRVANNMVDTVLRGGGIYGAIASTAKNMVMKFIEQEKSGRPDHAYTMIEMANLSPPVGSKLRKLYSATQTYKFNKDEIAERGFHISNPAYQAVGNLVSAVTNVPMDRLINKINNLRAATNEQNEAWQRLANFMGWNTWDVGSRLPEDPIPPKKRPKKKRKKRVRKKKNT